VLPSGAQPVRSGRRALLSTFLLGSSLLVALLLWPTLRPRLEDALSEARGANTSLLVAAGILFAAAPAGCGLLWQAVLGRVGSPLTRLDACSRYGVGSLVNTLAPAHIGDVVRTALLCESVPGRSCRSLALCFGGVQLARACALAALALASILPPAGMPALAFALVALLTLLGRRHRVIVTLSLLGPAAKVAAVALVLVAVGAPSAVRSAFAVVPALELAALLPLTPGNIGVASAAAAIALRQQGVPMDEAVAAAIVLHAVETAAGLIFGIGSTLLFLTRQRLRRPAVTLSVPRRRTRLEISLAAEQLE